MRHCPQPFQLTLRGARRFALQAHTAAAVMPGIFQVPALHTTGASLVLHNLNLVT